MLSGDLSPKVLAGESLAENEAGMDQNGAKASGRVSQSEMGETGAVGPLCSSIAGLNAVPMGRKTAEPMRVAQKQARATFVAGGE